MGCGRVGASLARAIERAGHEVAVIDQDEASFRRLGTSFDGRTVTGVGFDRDTLREAGIEQAYAFAAVSSGDNSNILAARVAREKFGVENVVARIYDPGRAEILAFMRHAVRQLGQTIVMVTHDPHAASYSNNVLFLADGQIIDSMANPTTDRVLDRMKQFEA